MPWVRAIKQVKQKAQNGWLISRKIREWVPSSHFSNLTLESCIWYTDRSVLSALLAYAYDALDSLRGIYYKYK